MIDVDILTMMGLLSVFGPFERYTEQWGHTEAARVPFG